jgi:glc operon protein GlcG
MRKSIMLGIPLGLTLLTASSAFAQLADKKVITLAAARKMVAAAEAEAERNHWAGVIAVVDDGGWPILVERMDNAAFTGGNGA